MHVFEAVVAEAVREAHHGAFWELDVEGVVVEGDGHLLEERHGETEQFLNVNFGKKYIRSYYYKACDDSIVHPQASGGRFYCRSC